MSEEQVKEETALELSTLGPNKGARKVSKRIGRGDGSGKGKTSGKGHKGQRARAGVSIPGWFEGGQMPLYRRVGKIGFRSRKKRQGINQYLPVSLNVLEKFEDGATVDIEALKSVGYSPKSSQKAGVKIVASGELKKKLTVKAHAFTASAKEAIEKAGGSVELITTTAKE